MPPTNRHTAEYLAEQVVSRWRAVEHWREGKSHIYWILLQYQWGVVGLDPN
jgi:hypothetical protein